MSYKILQLYKESLTLSISKLDLSFTESLNPIDDNLFQFLHIYPEYQYNS